MQLHEIIIKKLLDTIDIYLIKSSLFIPSSLFYRIDATFHEKGRLGRFCNHDSAKDANTQAERIEVDGKPAIILVAKKKINIGDEIRYDYCETDPSARALFPFLSSAAGS